jgi:hypothetical protein
MHTSCTHSGNRFRIEASSFLLGMPKDVPATLMIKRARPTSAPSFREPPEMEWPRRRRGGYGPAVTSGGRFRWRTSLRTRLPWFLTDLGVARKGLSDCGDHEFYRSSDELERCYHCVVGERPLRRG